ncbi:Viral movement protein [Abeliophyllum distichum]|uniref:Viral movement protein n=1 Tax=Abeliophyllum distichum TaxID=126358 RepID=A0ABD1RXY1_9LAMI
MPRQKKPHCFPTQFTITIENIPIYSFNAEGKPIHALTGNSRLQYWDVCFRPACRKLDDLSDDYRQNNRKPKRNNSQHKLHMASEDGSSNVGLLGEPSDKFDYYVKFSPSPTIDELMVPTGWDENDDSCS